MVRMRVLGIAVGLVIIITAVAAKADDHPVLSGTDARGEWGYYISDEQFAKTPKWKPEASSPPLTISDAVAITKRQIKPGRPSDVLVVGISLQSALVGDDYRWYYQISGYDGADVWRDKPPAIHDVVLLMDGTIVPRRYAKE